jgi:two-component system chemotaxis response regulator CheB
MAQPIRVMLVDDSAVIRGLFARALGEDGSIEIVATASNGQMALSMLKKENVEVIILDVEMPIMDGIQALPEILALCPKTKVIMASTLTQRNAEISVRAMQMGAADYIAKPSTRDATEVGEFYRSLISKIKALAPRDKPFVAAKPNVAGESAVVTRARETSDAEVSKQLYTPIPMPQVPVRQMAEPKRAEALAIASSTGGPQALLQVFREMKGKAIRTPIFITQHMPANFTAILADHIAKASGLPCMEALNNEEVVSGKVYIAPGDYHMTVVKDGGKLKLHLGRPYAA